MDDMLADPNAIERIVSFMESIPEQWIASETLIIPSRTHYIPSWNPYVWNANMLSGPSAITIRSPLKNIQLDNKLRMYLDLDWYYRLYLAVGKPAIFNSVTWINRTHPNQLTYQVSHTSINEEYHYILQKYQNKFVYCA
jgi:hypothetical protein